MKKRWPGHTAYLSGGSKAGTGYCVAWDSWVALDSVGRSELTMFPPLWTKGLARGIGDLWKPSFQYGRSSFGGDRSIVTKMAVTPLLSSSRDKGMLMFKRVICLGKG